MNIVYYSVEECVLQHIQHTIPPFKWVITMFFVRLLTYYFQYPLLASHSKYTNFEFVVCLINGNHTNYLMRYWHLTINKELPEKCAPNNHIRFPVSLFAIVATRPYIAKTLHRTSVEFVRNYCLCNNEQTSHFGHFIFDFFLPARPSRSLQQFQH